MSCDINIFMKNKSEAEYGGPDPKMINSNYPAHTYELVVCLLDGSCKRVLQGRYLKKYGHTRESYLALFPGAPLKSAAASENYRRAAFNDNGRRSKNLTELNLSNADFQLKRRNACKDFYESERSVDFKQAASARAKLQHENGHSNYVKEYFSTRYQGSWDQKNRSQRMQGRNNIIHKPGAAEKAKQTYIQNYSHGYHATSKKNFKHYNLKYQSSYEYHFLEYCELNGVIHLISNPPILKDSIYPRRFYLPDFVFDNKYIVEIKSWYIEKKQLSINPAVNEEKQKLVTRLGYSWLYVLDKNYQELDVLISKHTH